MADNFCDENIAEDPMIDLGALQSQQPKNFLVRNHFYFNDEINPDTARQLIVNLHELALSVASTCLESGTVPCPIELHLNSCGGSLSDALQIVQVIKDIQSGKTCKIGGTFVPIRVNTKIEGEADSAASLIASVGSYRTCSKYAMSLIHPMRSLDGTFKTVEEQKVAISNNDKWNRIYKDVYLEHSHLTEAELDKMFKTETYYTAQDLVSFGLVDEIV